MGGQYSATCRGCRHEFLVSEGGGFRFHLLHCDKCGKEKSLTFEKIGEPHLRYLKGLPGPYAIATADHDQQVKDTYPGEPLSEDEYHEAVERIAGKCRCRGRYRLDAPPRCPKCRATDFDTECHILYD